MTWLAENRWLRGWNRWRLCQNWFKPWETKLLSIRTLFCHLWDELSPSTTRSISLTMSPKTSSASKSNLSQFESISLLGFLSEWSCVGLVCVGLMRRASRWMESNTKVACSVLGTCLCRGPLVNSPTSPLIGRQKVETLSYLDTWSLVSLSWSLTKCYVTTWCCFFLTVLSERYVLLMFIFIKVVWKVDFDVFDQTFGLVYV